jgi:GxxExxY protein
MNENEIATLLLDAAFTIHRHLGPGLLESVYKECLFQEAKIHGLEMAREIPVPLIYKNVRMETGFRADLMAEKKVIVEVKSIEAIADIHKAQLLTYLKLSGIKLGILINFNVPLLKEGIRRMVNNL